MPESQNIEYKSTWRDEYLKWISGFANANGGSIFIGKDDAGKVVGLSDAKKLMEDIPNKVRDILGIMVDVNLHTENKKDYLEIKVEAYPSPVSYKGEYHYRSGSTKQELKGAALDKFLLRKQGKHWDGVPVPFVKLADFDKKAIAAFRKKALLSKRLSAEILKESDNSLLDKLHLTEKHYFKRSSILLFHSVPEKHITGAYVKIGFFKNDADLLFHDEIHGNIFEQIEKTMDLMLTKYLKAMISYKGVQRIESYSVPEEALREALINAVGHKDYGSGFPIQISVYEDKIMLWNPGTLPEGWTTKTLTSKHSSQPYNPDVANVLFRAGMIEAWGRGFEKITQACKKSGNTKFEIQEEPGGGLWLIFHFTKEKNTKKATVETTVETTVKTTAENSIIDFIAKNPKTTLSEIALQIGKSVRAVERAAAKLKKEGKITFVGPKKSGHWRINK
jgi:ATP-dependent DNA helicase RecG